ncbi:Zn(II)2Cys6 transcription factor [Aspergillus saccharolyticus JOP 1030-1]|uniref:Zn(II)2Cys6 transcription factor n=1 Tax=Aspergillus saccharolyticus JOP 1030-1 TaxID=1450539 RepID=A0A318ZU90_9EURO|nr:Zn(II)2Cys6 transcription factor [Aspergillus saccharolyticus JOP 1030-1]PYH43658.1 Zn(II)2Cys6 transcription factor [Aspergillus saccharolyticus JOP 1030-1]
MSSTELPIKGKAASRARGRYTTKACEECRQRKAKCDGKKPRCSRCAQYNAHCQYSGTEDGRRPAPKSYVLLLRQRIASLEKLLEIHGIDPRTDHDVSATRESGAVHTGEDPQIFSMSPSVDELCQYLKGRLSLDETMNFDQDGEMRYFGPTSGRLQFKSPEPGEEDRQENAYAVPEVEPVLQSIDEFLNIRIADPTIEESGISKALQDELVDLYFAWEQPWYPLVDETLFRESLETRGPYWSLLLHYSLLAVGARYSDSPEVRSDPSDSNTAGQPFLERAKTLLHQEMEHPNLLTIQALGNIGLYYIAVGSDAAGWLHHGMANRLSLDIGLNMDPAGFKGTTTMTPRELRLRRQVYWALYCHDKLFATYTGRVCSMLDQQAAVDLPAAIEEDQHATSHTPENIQKILIPLQRAMIALCRIKERILSSLWGPRHLTKPHERFNLLRTCLLDLRTWFYDLPQELRIDRANDVPHVYTLHMIYHTARILLTRPFLAHSLEHKRAEGSSESMAVAKSVRRESAKGICATGQKYRRVFQSFHRSPMSAMHSTLCAAVALLEDQESPSNAHYLACCITVLDELSTSWHPALFIGNNLRRLCPSISSQVTSRSGGSSENSFETQDLVVESDLAEVPTYEGGSDWQAGGGGGLAPWSHLPGDYGLFELLNHTTWDRPW